MSTEIREPGLCEATDGASSVPLRCDLPADHKASRHRERYVATWADEGSDVRWFDAESGRYLDDGPDSVETDR